MAVVPVRDGNDLRPAGPHEPHDVVEMRGRLEWPSVGPAEVDPPVGPQDGAGRFGFGQALLDRPIRPKLPLGEIAEPDAKAGRDVEGHGAPESDLDIVGVRPEHQKVDRRHLQDFSQVNPLAGYNDRVPRLPHV